MSLYLKYRSKDFSELVGQELIASMLQGALVKNKTVGSYLFHGGRGTGKTSTARIFAKALNCQSRKPDGNPCQVCQSCLQFDAGSFLDVIEIDAASNNGVDNIRDLIERVRYQPNVGPYKIYIIDEVHMLSGGAFNALLKTLEEPPEHAKFILATTEIQKIPLTIISRSQRYDFRKIQAQDIALHLQKIAKLEGSELEDEAANILGRLARGAMRDGLVLLEQILVPGIITANDVRLHFKLVDELFLQDFLKSLLQREKDKVIWFASYFRENSIHIRRMLEQLFPVLLEKIRQSNDKNLTHLYLGLEQLLFRLPNSPNEYDTFEVVLLTLIQELGNSPSL